MMKNILVGQSGGPTAVINASLYGVITEGARCRENVGAVYGMVNGVEGFLRNRYLNLSQELSEEQLKLLRVTPAAYLGSCRYKLPEDLTSSFYPMFFEKLNRLDVGYFLYIGGNDSMDTVSKLGRYGRQTGSPIRFIGVPKTIDNDLVLTDHTPGYGSAAKYVAATVREIVLDASVYQNPSVTIVELMGRHAGWLTAASVLARTPECENPMLVYLPETDFDFRFFEQNLRNALKKNPNVVVCVSEGLSDASGRLVCEYNVDTHLDTFGHKMLSGCGKVLENHIRNQLKVKVRSVELNVNQRCSGIMASGTDIDEAVEAGVYGVRAALDGESGKMVSMRRVSENLYQSYALVYGLEDVERICNKEKKFPAKWITKQGTDIDDEFLRYVCPLIQGEAKVQMVDGLPVYLYRKRRI